jgi:hypothetical protein
MALTTMGLALSGYSLASIAISAKKFLNLGSKIAKKYNVNAIELHSSEQNSPIYIGSPYFHAPIKIDDEDIFESSIGTFVGKFNIKENFTNYLYIGNKKSTTFICDLTKKNYEDKLKKYDRESWIESLIQSCADKKLYLHEINLDEVYTINRNKDYHMYDNKIGFYHESKKILSQYYILYTRLPLTFTSGMIGGLILYYDCL